MRISSEKNGYKWKVFWPKKETATYEAYMEDFGHIFQHTDRLRDVPDVFMNVVRHTSRIAEAVRRVQHDQLALALSDILAWLLTFTAKVTTRSEEIKNRDILFGLEAGLSEAIWMKYPDRCSVCFGGLFETRESKERLGQIAKSLQVVSIENYEKYLVVNSTKETDKLVGEFTDEIAGKQHSLEYSMCKCPAIPGVEERAEDNIGELGDAAQSEIEHKRRYEFARKLARRSYARAVPHPTPWTVSAIEDMFRRIYGNNLRAAHMEDVANHLQEEVGEIAGALTDVYTYHPKYFPEPGRTEVNKRNLDLAEEIADTFSWAHACLFKINESFKASLKYHTVVNPTTRNEPSQDLHMGDIIWAGWGQITQHRRKERWHLFCGECLNQEICSCDWLVETTYDGACRILERP